MRDRKHSQHLDGPDTGRYDAPHDHGDGDADMYGFWKDEPTRSLRSLIPTRPSATERRARRGRDTAPIEQIDSDPTPLAAYDPWLDDDLATASFDSVEHTGSHRYAAVPTGRSSTYDSDYGWDVGEDFEIDAATPLATVSTHRGGTIDPLLKRVGLMIGAMALLIPVGMAARGDHQPSSSLKAPPSSIEAAPSSNGALDSAVSSAAAASASTVAATALAATAPPPATQTPSSATASTTKVAASGSGAASAGSAGTTAIKSLKANPVCGYSSYQVVAGDFWVSIANAANVRVADLLTINNASKDTPLHPGNTICMPPKAKTASSSTSATTAAPGSAAATSAAPTTAAQTTAAPTTQKPPTTATPTTRQVPATAAPTTATPTTRPPSTSTPAGTAPRNTYTKAQVIQIIRDVWPDDLEDEAIRIATRESNLTPTVRNFCCFGLFQVYYSVHKTWLGAMGITSPEMLYDPVTNAKAAYALYQRAGGWGPWRL